MHDDDDKNSGQGCAQNALALRHPRHAPPSACRPQQPIHR